ncbi:bifunctional folylpolyglutamate synthase/dihydrofolate synthase [Sphingopyxis sp. PAMC25046]|uniref:bifunctional folylpolyglutamate synthase/dihydrofolate synthase n=1 Tax=Sphingopyxis sp. PAMC25046 TaxID=2565556 RepID=UPI00109E22E3|nr:folylpolyglutamate synthase/dihydrofolate synthase family protein [Sphingopyxis sp. PAMC25046]QCB55036.1 bifunctional folylpolyglutamate synthase/dihydrofolate synthase [Sphingopyxis sp. PAMC25046]
MPDHAHSSDPAVQTQLDRLAALSPGRDILGLERIAELCARLGNPQLQLPRTFHVAGTNGKGSTCAYLRAILEAQGRRVHAYTSPHLVRFNERIRLSGKLIDDTLLAALLEEVLDEAADLQASFFEITTAAAFLAFARIPADDCIIEVGLGGRLDATNVIPAPAVCGIASLGIDHEAFLLAHEDGTPSVAIERIAWEKSGIFKPGAALATLAYPDAVMDLVGKRASAVGGALFSEGDGWRIETAKGGFRWLSNAGNVEELLLTRMAGVHQMRNAGLAIAMLRSAPDKRPDDAVIGQGVADAFWPARMQRLGDGPLTALLPEGAALWLDGGHNPDAGAALAQALSDAPPLHIVCGLLANKDAMGFLRPFSDRIASFQAVPIPGHEHYGPKDLCRAVEEKLGIAHAQPCNDVAEALRHIAAHRPPGDVLVCGSLYLAGVVLDANGELPD